MNDYNQPTGQGELEESETIPGDLMNLIELSGGSTDDLTMKTRLGRISGLKLIHLARLMRIRFREPLIYNDSFNLADLAKRLGL